MMPLKVRDCILELRESIPNKSKSLRVVSLYDNDRHIKEEIKDKIIKNHSIILGDSIIRCWISGEYAIDKLKKTKCIPLCGHLILSTKGLFYDESLVISLTPTEQKDFLYFDFKLFQWDNTDYYAFRTGNRLFVSNNLKEWIEIYNGKRGIKNSMVFTQRDNSVFLLFIEYTPGVIREKHHILEYGFKDCKIRVLKEFSTYNEYLIDNRLDCCRHIHVIDIDPYTGDIYVGTGDNDVESAIWVSKDSGKSFKVLYRNGQLSRTLSFMFTKNSVFWTMDSHEQQFIIRYDKRTRDIGLTPIVNGALWHSFKLSFEGSIMYVVGSNSEGAHYDNKNRVYAITLDNDNPCVYELASSVSYTQYDQLFPIYVNNSIIYFYDIMGSCIRYGRIKK